MLPAAAMFTVQVDRARLFVDVRISGFFTAELSNEVRAHVRATIAALGRDVGRHVTLYDVSAVQVAPGTVIDAVKADFADRDGSRLRARRIAYCTPSALARLQAARICEGHADMAVFATRDEAIAWLTAAADAQVA